MTLLLCGVGLLSYFTWAFYGTNWVAAKEQRQILQQLELQWEAEKPAGVVRSKNDYPAPKPEESEPYAIVRIPAFGSGYAVPLVGGVSDDALGKGFGHFPSTAQVGEEGNFALAAHRVTHNEPLRLMPELDPGDEVIIETQDALYTYVLDTPGDGLEVSFTDGWVVSEDPQNPDGGVEPKANEARLLTLTTCAELFHTDERLVAFGHLASVEEKN